MTIVATLDAVATIDGTADGAVAADATIAPSPLVPTADTVTADVTYDGSLALAAYPGAAHQHLAGLRVTIDGETLPLARVLPGATVTRTLGEGCSWSLPLLLRGDWPERFAYPAGRPEGYLGPPPGGAEIDIDGLYMTATGLKATRLITGGVVENCSEVIGELDTYALNGTDADGRIDRRKINLTLPPGHGLTRAAVAGRIAALLGVDDYAFAAAGRMDKRVQAVEADGLALMADILLPAGRVPQRAADGTLYDPERVVRGGGYDVILTEANLLRAGGLGRTSTTDGPTRIVVTGERQVTRDGCGRVTIMRFVEAVEEYTRKEAAFRQTAAGVLTAQTPTQFPQLQVVSRVTTVEERECDRLISSRVITQEMHSPSAYRYELDTDGSHKAWSTYWIFEPGAVADDGALAYAWPVERFVTTGDVLTVYHYDADGFETGSTVTTRGWHQRRTPVKEQAPQVTVPWEEEPYIVDVPVLGNGEGVFDRVETYFGPYHGVARNAATNWVPQVGAGTVSVVGAVGVKRETVAVGIQRQYADDGTTLLGGFKRREITTAEGWLARPVVGGPYYYAADGGTESIDSVERFWPSGLPVIVRTERVEYIPEAGDGSHGQFSAARDHDGKRINGEPDQHESGLEGYLPAAERATPLEPDAADFPDGAGASPRESQPIECDHRVNAPASLREPWTDTISDAWVETQAEACRLAADEASLRWAFRVTATIPIAFPLREGMRVLIVDRPSGTFWPVHVKSVVHTIPERGVLATTVLSGDQYVV